MACFRFGVGGFGLFQHEMCVSDSPDVLHRNSCNLLEHKAICEKMFFIHAENRTYSLQVKSRKVRTGLQNNH